MYFCADSVRTTHINRARDDSGKKGNASGSSDSKKHSNMESLAQAEHFDGKDSNSQDKGSGEGRDGKSSGSSIWYFRRSILSIIY